MGVFFALYHYYIMKTVRRPTQRWQNNIKMDDLWECMEFIVELLKAIM